MTDETDRAAAARAIIDANSYMTLGTADAGGRPWVSPVWYAPASYREFLWVSKPGAQHSRNLAERPELAIVIFDSHGPGAGSAVYMSATAAEVDDAGLDDGIAAFSARSRARSLPEWTRADVEGDARHRLFRATVSEAFILDSHDERLPVSL